LFYNLRKASVEFPHLRSTAKQLLNGIHQRPTLHQIQGCIQKFPEWPPAARTANGTALYL